MQDGGSPRLRRSWPDRATRCWNGRCANRGRASPLFEGSGAGSEAASPPARRWRPACILGADGGYNVEAVRGLAGVADLVLLQWAWRDQGLIVRRGNPLGLSSVGDLASKAPRMVLRQAGSGAETLLEDLLEKAGVPRSALERVGPRRADGDRRGGGGRRRRGGLRARHRRGGAPLRARLRAVPPRALRPGAAPSRLFRAARCSGCSPSHAPRRSVSAPTRSAITT